MPALIEVKETDKIEQIDILYVHGVELFNTGVILRENAQCVLEISTEKPEFQAILKRM